MEKNQKDLLGRILSILKQCDSLDEKTLTPAKNLITYIGYAYNKKLMSVPETYREFAQQIKHHYLELKRLKTDKEKIEVLTKIVEECHASLEAIQ